MRASLRAFCGALGASFVLIPVLSASVCAADDSAARGRELFERVWQSSSAPHPAPDGLGPLFNERSCVACHSLGGIGGAGPNDKNVELLTPSAAELSSSGPTDRFRNVHPGFATASTVVLHKFSTETDAYAEFRGRLLGFDSRILHEPRRQELAERAILRGQRVPNRAVKVRGVEFIVSRRNTTPLFGLGLIDTIPDFELNSVARQQARQGTVSGRFLGRFGWRGQVKKLDNFVRSACATELGLQLATHRQPVNPLDASEDPLLRRPFDVSAGECRDLTEFVSRLPQPRRVLSDDRQQLIRIKNGEALFDTVGCAQCHRATLANVSGLYSDLLVHDMGPALADPAPAPIDPLLPSAAGYYENVELANERRLTEARREWKTPPLWGLRDSAPYLHDGRADTVDQAIKLHGGEAQFAVHRYRELPSPQRQNILAFLATLAAPHAITSPQ